MLKCMSKYMLVDFKKAIGLSKPSDSKYHRGFKIFSGGAGGNRTPVRKPSAGSSTYLAMLFMFNFYFTNKQANIKASYLKFKKLLSNPIISESLFMTL